jgi:hypothetical protein
MFQEISNGINNSSSQWVLTPYNCSLKIWKLIGTPTPKMGMCEFIPSQPPTLPRAWNVTPRFHSQLAPLQALALVMSPRLGSQHGCFINLCSNFMQLPFLSFFFPLVVFNTQCPSYLLFLSIDPRNSFLHLSKQYIQDVWKQKKTKIHIKRCTSLYYNHGFRGGNI